MRNGEVAAHLFQTCFFRTRPPLWSSFWLQIPGATDFLSSSGSGTGSTQPREANRGAT